MLSGLSVVVPAFNEAATIGRVVREAFAVADKVAADVEVLVCDDGSGDATGAIVQALCVDEPRLRLLVHAKNRGIEATLRSLYDAARKPYVFLISADGQWPMESLLPMAHAVADGAEFVVGVRRDRATVYSAYRRVLSATYAWTVRALGGPFSDPGSIKLARRELLARPVVARGVFAEGERVLRAARDGARVAHVDVDFRPRRAGRAQGARPAVVAVALADVVRVARSLRVGRAAR